jgi:hypothetical protein
VTTDREAAQLRIAELERELVELRAHCEKLEAELAGGHEAEGLANARRLATAIEREQVARRQRLQAEATGRIAQGWRDGPSPAGLLTITLLLGIAGVVLIIAAIIEPTLHVTVDAIVASAGAVALLLGPCRAAFGGRRESRRTCADQRRLRRRPRSANATNALPAAAAPPPRA